MLPSDLSRLIEQAKFTFSSLLKTLEKQTKSNEDQQICAVMNQKERQMVLINKDGKNLSHIEIFEEFAREEFDEII